MNYIFRLLKRLDLQATISLEKKWIRESNDRIAKFKKQNNIKAVDFELLLQMKSNKRIHDLNMRLIDLKYPKVNDKTPKESLKE